MEAELVDALGHRITLPETWIRARLPEGDERAGLVGDVYIDAQKAEEMGLEPVPTEDAEAVPAEDSETVPAEVVQTEGEGVDEAAAEDEAAAAVTAVADTSIKVTCVVFPEKVL